MPIGRGGSGNIWQAQIEKQAAKEDVEAQVQEEQATIPNQTQPAEYAHGGRGGAGNWYRPKELAATGTFSSEPVKPAPTGLNRTGRGGAGNFIYAEGQEDQKKLDAEQEEKIQQIQAAVASDVEQLASPAKAKVPSEKVA